MRRDSTRHVWQFFRAGDFDQVALTSGRDLMGLDTLDQKLWAALGCPVDGLHFDHRTLQLIDSDGDGRVRARELINAVKWAGERLKTPDDLLNPAESLPLAAIDDGSDAGAAMLAAAKHVLGLLGKHDADALSVADTAEARDRFAQMPFNGDGIVTHESAAGDDAAAALIDAVIASLGADVEASGKPGVSGEKLEQFLAELERFVALRAQAEQDPAIRVLGESTAEAAEAFAAVADKITDYFARTRLAEFDVRAAAAMNRADSEYAALASERLMLESAEIAELPLAHVEPGNKPLDLSSGLNPAWESRIERFRTQAVIPLLGERTAVTLQDFRSIEAKLAPFREWSAAVGASGVAALDSARLDEIAGGRGVAALRRLIERDREEADTAAMIVDVDRFVRYCRYLKLLCENFVNFRHFYGGDSQAIFQAGTLYIDQRSCDLTLYVDDAAKAAPMVSMAGTYLLYCDIVRRATGDQKQIVAAVTNGDSDNLMVGRNGVFYDRDGRDWDATITKIVDNPISVRQAFWSPYKKLVRLIEEQVAKRAAAADEASSQHLESAATSVANADRAKPEAKKIDVGTVAALGVAFGALATATAAFAGYASGLMRLPFWQLCIAIAGLVLIVSGPSVLIAWLKLRKRNLGPILDANGWAVNAKARLNVPFGATLTGVAHLPKGSRIVTRDRFGQRPAAWPRLVAVVIILGFVYSLLNDYGLIRTLTNGWIGDEAGTQSGFESLLMPSAEPTADDAAAAAGDDDG